MERQTSETGALGGEYAALAQKTAVRFGKTGPAVYHSHHDMIRFWERAVKRAELPARHTQGFNPRPRLIFPHALGLGIASRHEEVEIELYRRVELASLLARLRHAVAGAVEVLSAENVPAVKKSRQLVESSYHLSGWDPAAFSRLGAISDALLAEKEIRVERGKPGETRVIDIRPYVRRLFPVHDEMALGLVIGHTPLGAARPDEIARLAAAEVGADWRDVRIEKTGMKLEFAG